MSYFESQSGLYKVGGLRTEVVLSYNFVFSFDPILSTVELVKGNHPGGGGGGIQKRLPLTGGCSSEVYL